MRMQRRLKIAVLIFAPIAAFVAWFYIAANYDYGALSGEYVYKTKDASCVLYLHSDTTFVQNLSDSGRLEHVHGQWRRYGQAGVSFSNEFLKLPGQEFDGSNAAFGKFDKTLGIFPKLTLAPLPGGPVFHKKWPF
jgi:hypothetical protein